MKRFMTSQKCQLNNFGRWVTLPKAQGDSKFELTGAGILTYDPKRGGKVDGKNWCVVNLYDDTPQYVQYLLSKEFKIPHMSFDPPSWGSHVSVVRGEKLLKNSHLWRKFHGDRVSFKYSKDVYMTKSGFIFLEVCCPELTSIRDSFGLKSDWNFHLTVGKIKQ